MAKVLLINPAYYEDIFASSNVRAAISPGTPPHGLATLAAPLRDAGHEVRILDLNVSDSPSSELEDALRGFSPDYAGITSTTPLIKKALSIAAKIKSFAPSALVAAGGPHPSALPEETLSAGDIDCVVRGEGDYALPRIIAEGLHTGIPNLYYKAGGRTEISPVQGHLTSDLDTLPFPAYDLLRAEKYRQPRLSARLSPLAYMETSRGCYARCVYCNKNICGFKLRMKTPSRVVDEMEHLLGLGFREIHIIDDIFTADMDRAEAVCEEIMRRGLEFPWYPRGGIRVDRVRPKLLAAMKRAGCYRIPFGVESGSQRVLDVIQKRITLEQAEAAVRMAREASLETECYFMLGLPTETEEDMRRTIEFAVRIDPDFAKFAITIPLPGTPMFETMSAEGRIRTREWEKFNFSTPPRELYDHDILSGEKIDSYRAAAYRRFYFRPGYAARTLLRVLREGTFLYHLKAFFQTRWS